MKHYVVFYGRICGIFDSWDAVKDTYDQAVEALEKFEEDGTTPY